MDVAQYLAFEESTETVQHLSRRDSLRASLQVPSGVAVMAMDSSSGSDVEGQRRQRHPSAWSKSEEPLSASTTTAGGPSRSAMQSSMGSPRSRDDVLRDDVLREDVLRQDVLTLPEDDSPRSRGESSSGSVSTSWSTS